MEVISQKLSNLKHFVKDKSKEQNNTTLTIFYNMSAEMFVSLIKSHIANNRITTEDDKRKLFNEMFEKCGIDQRDYNGDDLQKLRRYIDYFLEIVQNI